MSIQPLKAHSRAARSQQKGNFFLREMPSFLGQPPHTKIKARCVFVPQKRIYIDKSDIYKYFNKIKVLKICPSVNFLEKMKKQNRTKYLRVRVTESELKELDKQVKRTFLQRSEYLRRLIFGRLETIDTRENYLLREGLLLQVSQINNNVNQIARALNAMLKHGESFTFTTLQTENIRQINDMIKGWNEMKADLLKKL